MLFCFKEVKKAVAKSKNKPNFSSKELNKQESESVELEQKISWKYFYEQATSFLFESIDIKPGSQTWFDYVRFYNGMAVAFPEKFSNIIIFKRVIIERTGASDDNFEVIKNTPENRSKYLLKVYPTEYLDKVEQQSDVHIGVGIADDPTIGIDTVPDDIASQSRSNLPLPGVTSNPNAGVQYPPISQESKSLESIKVEQLTKDGLPSSS
jgi:hypothetical protein